MVVKKIIFIVLLVFVVLLYASCIKNLWTMLGTAFAIGRSKRRKM